eukprot:1161352-Pelagomonas_calceolata.AAC.13
MSVAPGEVVALVGSSGGGKSSIVKLLVGVRGTLLCAPNGRGADRWQRHRGIQPQVAQTEVIYGLEPEDGVEPPSQAEIESAARQANAHDFISSFPDGYDTEFREGGVRRSKQARPKIHKTGDCGEKGVSLSGGQVRRSHHLGRLVVISCIPFFGLSTPAARLLCCYAVLCLMLL